MAAPASAEAIRDVNTRYHDAAAEHYDTKWGVDYGDIGRNQVRGKLHKLLGKPLPTFERSLEIGSGTGYFTLNMLQDGVVVEATATDISPGMLSALEGNAKRLGLKVETQIAEAERLPFLSNSFDLVFGHAVLHHIPDLAQGFSEFHRVLRPGGVIAFCGEPSRYGDLIAVVPKRVALTAAPLWRRLAGASKRDYEAEPDAEDHKLEAEVDVHAFTPGDLRRFARDAGFADTRVSGEELLASMHGWTMRTLEGSAVPEEIPWGWKKFAFRSYLALQKLDRRVLEPRLPPELFYNLLISARKA